MCKITRMSFLVYKWHSWLDMPKFNYQWHVEDIADEMLELKHAKGFWARWSEKSDVAYAYTRALWSGFGDFKWPLSFWDFFVGAIYMIPKYTLRFLFFLYVGKSINKSIRFRCVRNPRKPEKLRNAAIENGIDPDKFVKACEKKSNLWLFLP